MKDFAIEICILAGIVLYLINMVMGARANRQIANRWCMLFGIGKGILPQQFAHVGIGELSTPAFSNQLNNTLYHDQCWRHHHQGCNSWDSPDHGVGHICHLSLV